MHTQTHNVCTCTQTGTQREASEKLLWDSTAKHKHIHEFQNLIGLGEAHCLNHLPSKPPSSWQRGVRTYFEYFYKAQAEAMPLSVVGGVHVCLTRDGQQFEHFI